MSNTINEEPRNNTEKFIIVSRRDHTIESAGKNYNTHILTVKRVESDGRESAEFDMAYNNLLNIYTGKNEVYPNQVYFYPTKNEDNKYAVPEEAESVVLQRCEVKKDSSDKTGYMAVIDPLGNGGFIKTKYLHKITLFSFDGRPNLNIQVDHKDNNTYNNAYSNLEYMRATHNAFKAIAVRDSAVARKVLDLFLSKNIKDFNTLMNVIINDYTSEFITNTNNNKGALAHNLDNFANSLLLEDIYKNRMNVEEVMELLKGCEKFLTDKVD
jgi:hypothetical protein